MYCTLPTVLLHIFKTAHIIVDYYLVFQAVICIGYLGKNHIAYCHPVFLSMFPIICLIKAKKETKSVMQEIHIILFHDDAHVCLLFVFSIWFSHKAFISIFTF